MLSKSCLVNLQRRSVAHEIMLVCTRKGRSCAQSQYCCPFVCAWEKSINRETCNLRHSSAPLPRPPINPINNLSGQTDCPERSIRPFIPVVTWQLARVDPGLRSWTHHRRMYVPRSHPSNHVEFKTWMLRLGIAGPVIRAARSGCEICSQSLKLTTAPTRPFKLPHQALLQRREDKSASMSSSRWCPAHLQASLARQSFPTVVSARPGVCYVGFGNACCQHDVLPCSLDNEQTDYSHRHSQRARSRLGAGPVASAGGTLSRTGRFA